MVVYLRETLKNTTQPTNLRGKDRWRSPLPLVLVYYGPFWELRHRHLLAIWSKLFSSFFFFGNTSGPVGYSTRPSPNRYLSYRRNGHWTCPQPIRDQKRPRSNGNKSLTLGGSRTCKWLISMVIVSPQRIGLWDFFQIAMTYKWGWS